MGDEFVTLDDAIEKIIEKYNYSRIGTNPRTYKRWDYRNSVIVHKGRELSLDFYDKLGTVLNQIQFVDDAISVRAFFVYPQHLASKASEIGPDFDRVKRIAVYAASTGADVVENKMTHQDAYYLICQLIEYEDQAAIFSKA